MKISITILLAMLILTGCADGGIQTKKSDTLSVICEDEKGVEYMGFRSGKGGGLSLRYNQDGSIATCHKKFQTSK